MARTNRNPGAGNAGASALDHHHVLPRNTDRGRPSQDRDQESLHALRRCVSQIRDAGVRRNSALMRVAKRTGKAVPVEEMD